MRTVAILFSLAIWAVAPHIATAADPDTLVVFDAAAETPGTLPAHWNHVLPKGQYVYTAFTLERSIDGNYLRARSTGAGSQLEITMDSIEPSDYPILAWEWKVDEFPETQWEEEEGQDDFAIRVELVFDFHGTWKNPINILRKGFFTSVFKRYPPEHTISYVWSVNVPSLEPYTSPESRRMTVIPIESSRYIQGRWINERTNFQDILRTVTPRKDLVLKKIIIRADTDNTGGTAESGIKYMYLVGE